MSICYGLEIYMFLHSLRLFLQCSAHLRKQRLMYMIIGGLSLSLTTVVVFTDVVFMEFMWIEHRDFEGGPLAYLKANSSIWWQTFGTAANQVTNFLGDGLLLYRCFIIWQGNWWIILFPLLIYLGSVAMAMVTLVQSALPGADFFRGETVNFGVPWAALSVSLNIIVTCLITFKLLSARRQLKQSLPEDSLRMYTGVSAILVESALPFSVLGIVFAVTYGKNLDVGPAFLFVWAAFCALSPQFIIFRVTVGKSWTANTITRGTTVTMFHSETSPGGESKISHKTFASSYNHSFTGSRGNQTDLINDESHNI